MKSCLSTLGVCTAQLPSPSTLEGHIHSEIYVGLPLMGHTAAAYAILRYKKIGVAYEAARESVDTAAKREKDYYDMGVIQNQFNVGDDVPIRMAPLNSPATKPHSK